MSTTSNGQIFTGSIPQLYERYLVPLIFDVYAADVAARVAALEPERVLEIAAGTGVVTRKLSAALAPDAMLVATDLNQPMIDHAAALGTPRTVQWRQADAMQLPFADGSFDAVACQFGAMFFPDKAHAYAEAYRVLRPGGTFVLNVWDRIEANEYADTVTRALAEFFPADPPRFLARLPHGYCDAGVIAADLQRGGFARNVSMETIAHISHAAAPDIPAIAYCQGTPLRIEIEAHGAAQLDAATEFAARALARRFGHGAIDGRIQAHVITATR